jgi:hypothetical protein
MNRIHQNPIALLKSGSFRPSVYSAGLAGHGDTAVFKTSAIGLSAIPPRGNHSGKSFRERAIYRPFAWSATAPGNGLIQEAFREDV